MNPRNTLLLLTVIAAGLTLTGCGSSQPKNPEVQQTKAVLGDPSTIKVGGKPANAAPGQQPGAPKGP